ncbi:MAG: ribose-phosphate diphosphokinase [Desulfurococcales archaeon]|nr:ribose-phosphate diphosphokinase [Desulfurococcales archaeon]
MAVIVQGPSPGSRDFALGLSKALDYNLVEAYHKTFPDGEAYVRVEAGPQEVAVVVQTFSRPQDTSFVQALLLADALRGLGFQRVVLVAPYLAYARQDKRFLPGEPVSIAVVLRSLSTAGYTDLMTIEIHKEEALTAFKGNGVSISPYEYMARQIGLDGSYIYLAPDVGALKRVERLARALGARYDYLVKKRDRITGEVTIETKHLDVRGEKVVIVDDIISTGGTVSRAAQLLLEQGARQVEVLVAHAILAGNALEKLISAGVKRVYAANTLPPHSSDLLQYIDVSPLVAERVKSILSGVE